jgi:DNA-binding PadR family transcriptional regulator
MVDDDNLSPAHHLGKLESAGYVETRNVRSFHGWRQSVEITPEGFEKCKALLRTIRALDV